MLGRGIKHVAYAWHGRVCDPVASAAFSPLCSVPAVALPCYANRCSNLLLCAGQRAYIGDSGVAQIVFSARSAAFPSHTHVLPLYCPCTACGKLAGWFMCRKQILLCVIKCVFPWPT